MVRKIFILAAFVLVNSIAAKPSDFDREIALGDKAFKAFDNENALKHYSAAIALNPENFDARFKYLRTNNSLGQNLRDRGASKKESEFYFRKNLDLAESLYKEFPQRAEAAFCLAIAYGNLALYASAREKVELSRHIEKTLKRAIELNPKFPYSYLGLGIFYREVSQINFLERFFAKLLWGEIPRATLEQAEEHFKKSISMEPTFLFTHFHYAKTLELNGKLREAGAEYGEVLKRPETDSGDAYLKTESRRSLKDLQLDNPGLFAEQSGAVE